MYLIYDLEIKNAIPPKNREEMLPGIEYCRSWGDFQGMGISVIGFSTLDFSSDEDQVDCFVFDPSPAIATFELAKQSGFKVGGFNSKKFDDKLLAANYLNVASDFDILDMVLEAADMKGVQYWKLAKPRSYTLDAITQANGMSKTGRGDLAPILWQQGKQQEVIDYCRNDAWIEREVLRLLLAGELIDPNTGEKLHWQ